MRRRAADLSFYPDRRVSGQTPESGANPGA